MNVLAKQIEIIAALTEGVGIRATARLRQSGALLPEADRKSLCIRPIARSFQLIYRDKEDKATMG